MTLLTKVTCPSSSGKSRADNKWVDKNSSLTLRCWSLKSWLRNSPTFRIYVKNNSTVKLLEKIQQIVLQKSSFVLVLINFPAEADINRTVSSWSAFITEFKKVKFKVYSWRRLCLDKVFTSVSDISIWFLKSE